MRKYVLSLSAFFLLVGFLTSCKDTYQSYSPGPGDRRITGTWQLAERRFPTDSVYYAIDSVLVAKYYRKDSVFVAGKYVRTDSTLVPDHYEKDSIKTAKTVAMIKRYPATPPQTLTFGPDGTLTATGSDLSYYFPIKYFRIDSTYRDSLGYNQYVSLFINTNRANQYFQQAVEFKKDSLKLKPGCAIGCYLTFYRVK